MSSTSRPISSRLSVERIAYGVVPLGIALVAIAYLSAGDPGIRFDLQLTAPEVGRRGHSIGLRSFFVVSSERPEPEFPAVPVRVSLLSGSEPMATTTLEPSASGDVAGAIVIPPSAPASVRLRAEVAYDGENIAIERSVRLDDAPPNLVATPRRTSPLQRFRVLERTGTSLDLAFVNGGCVPGAPCEMSIEGADDELDWIISGEPGFARIERVGNRLRGDFLGPEGEVRFAGPAEERRLARFRVPVIQRGIPFRASVREAKLMLDVELMEPTHASLDLFCEGRWIYAATVNLRDGTNHPDIPVPEQQCRVQLRPDPFSLESATSFLLPPTMETQALHGLEDPIALPMAVRSRDLAEIQAERKQRRLRWLLAMSLALGALIVVVVLARRGIRASSEAQKIMDGFDADRAVPSTLLSALGVLVPILLVLFVFLAAAILLLSKGLF
ncbi:MAG: hypothetical protein KC416_05395 [Myxococcales bacterium]|nr:hypothetical protein [Myxococcales bacterium]